MLTTQIGGLLQRIVANEDSMIEETARLLAQATIGEGRVIFAGFNGLDAVTENALQGAEQFCGAVRYRVGMEISSADRVWILTRFATDSDALELAHVLASRFIPFATLAADKPGEDNELATLSYTYISTGLMKGLLPDEDGGRIVQPHALAALFVYEALKMEYDDMVKDD
ncbi:DUF2529 family protein [Filibacter tadaridae]|nr:DUF2529 family protein [Filibacter tadaridae]